MAIKRDITIGELLVAVAAIATAIGTFVLACQTAKNIKLAQDQYIGQNRPWLSVELTDSGVQEDQASGYVTLTVKNVGRSPARSVNCFVQQMSLPRGAGVGDGFGIGAPNTVLPDQSVLIERRAMFKGAEYYDSIFKHGHEARVKVICSYGMAKAGEFRTTKILVLSPGENKYRDDTINMDLSLRTTRSNAPHRLAKIAGDAAGYEWQA